MMVNVHGFWKLGLLAMLALALLLWGLNFGIISDPNSPKLQTATLQVAGTTGSGTYSPPTCGVGGSAGCEGGADANNVGAGTAQVADLQAQIGAGSEYQEINMTVDNGWLPGSFVVKTGVPVRWNVYVKQFGGCINGLRASDLGIDWKFQQVGETKVFEFTPTKAGTIYFTCLMGMARGQIEVRDDVTVSGAAATNAAAANNPAKKTGGCGCGGGSSGRCGG